MNIRSLLCIFFLAATSSSSFAQRTDFSGTWTLNDQQGISGKMYSNGVPKQIKVTQTLKDITIER